MDVIDPSTGTLATVAVVDLSPDDPERETLLREAYEALVPGGLLIASYGDTRLRRRGRRSTRAQAAAADLGAALHVAGFCETRFDGAGSRIHRAFARRSHLSPPGKRDLVLSVVVPVYNERATFRELMSLLLEKQIDGMQIEIIIVESNSTDGTREDVLALADHPRVTAVFEDAPRGKGHAVRTGLKLAAGDFVLIQDADLEYNIDDYERLLAPIRNYEAAFVLGRRSTAEGRKGMRHFESQSLTSNIMNCGHLLFLAMFNAVYQQRLSDPFTMYKVFRRDCISGMIFESHRFDFDWELTAKLIRAGYRPLEIPVSYRSRSFREGKKIRMLRDPISWVRACMRYRYAPIFEPIGVAGTLCQPPTPDDTDSAVAGER